MSSWLIIGSSYRLRDRTTSATASIGLSLPKEMMRQPRRLKATPKASRPSSCRSPGGRTRRAHPPAGRRAPSAPAGAGRRALLGGPADRARVAAIQRLAGNAAATAYVQRHAGPVQGTVQRGDPPATLEYTASTVRAKGPDDTAAVIWRDADGSIIGLAEFAGNAELDRYLKGSAELDDLIAAGQAQWAQLSVSASALPRPAAPAGPAPEPAPASSRWGSVAKFLATLYKQLRTGRILAFLSSKRTYDDAQKVVSATLAQIKVLKRQARGLANRVGKSGGGAKVQARLAEVEAEIAKLEQVVAEQRAALRSAQAAMKAEQAAAKGVLARIRQLLGHEGVAKEKAGTWLWRTVGRYLAPRINRLVAFLEASSSGTKLLAALRKLSNPWVGRVLIGATAVFEGVNAYVTSKNRTTAGKAADATITGASEALVVANPVTAIADLVLPKDYKLSKLYRGGSGAVTAIGEGLLTGDTSAMEDFHEASKRGEYGKVMQAASEAGDYWAEHGIVGGLKDFGRELWDWL